MQCKKIIVINDFAHVTGGADQVALAGAIALSERDYEVYFFAAVTPVSDELRKSKVKVVCLGQPDILRDPQRLRAGVRGLWNVEASRRLEDLLANCNNTNTIVHIHSWTKALTSSVVNVSIKRGFSVVLTLHDYFLACPNGGFFNYQKGRVCHERPLSPQCLLMNCDSRSYKQKLWRAGRQLIQQKLGKLPQGISDFIVVSEFSKKILSPFLPEDARFHYIDNPICMPKREPAIVEGSDVFCYVGRLAAEKGPQLFARAASQLCVKASFIGEGPMRREIQSLYPDAFMPGWVSRQELMSSLASARALVFPSLWYETLGLSVLEAAALGVPAIVASETAASCGVEDGVTGLLFRNGDLSDLKAKIQVMRQPLYAKAMGSAAYRRYWAKPMTLDNHVEQLDSCYRLVLERRGRGF